MLLLAAAARIINVSSWPAATDEGWSIWAASAPHLEAILHNVATDRHPPLYFLALGIWRTVAGESRLALRALTVFGGLLTAAATYRIGADWFGRRTGLYAALVLAVLDIAIYYGQEVRHYGWLTLFAALSWLFFLRLLRVPNRPAALGYILSSAAMLYTLYFGALVLLAQGITWLLWRVGWREKLRIVGAWLVIGLLYLPWLIVILQQQAAFLGDGISGYPGTIATTPENLLPILALVFGAQVALAGGLYVLGAVDALQRPTIQARAVVLGGGGLFLLMIALSLRFDFLAARTLVFLTPLLAVIVGVGFTGLSANTARVLAAAVVIVLLLDQPVIQPRLDSDTAAQAVAAQFSAGDVIILETGWDDNAFAYEFRLALPDGTPIIRTLPYTDPAAELRPLLNDYRRAWVIQWLQAPAVLPALTAADDWQMVLALDTPVGVQYDGLYGDATIRARLFARPDLSDERWQFGDRFALHDALLADTARPGQPLPVDLWWSAHGPVDRDYSSGVFLMDSGGAVVSEAHSPVSAEPTSTWSPGAIHHDRRTLSLPSDLPAGAYTVLVNLYWYVEPEPLPVGDAAYAVVGTVRVAS